MRRDKEILEKQINDFGAQDAEFKDGYLWLKGGNNCPNTGRTFGKDEWHKTMYPEGFIRLLKKEEKRS